MRNCYSRLFQFINKSILPGNRNGIFVESVAPDDGNFVTAGSHRIVLADSVSGISRAKISARKG